MRSSERRGSALPSWPRGTLAAAGRMLLCMAVTSCGDLAHTNPYDPVTPVSLTLAGPDSATSAGDVLQFTLQATPAFESGPVSWQVEGPYASWLLATGAGGTGSYVAAFPVGAESVPRQISIKATLTDGRFARKTIVAYQRPASLHVQGCDYFFRRNLTFGALRDSSAMCAALLDRTGHGVSTIDPVIVTTRNGQARATVNGISLSPAGPSAWITALDTGVTTVVFARGAFRDSITVSTRQRLLFLGPMPGCSTRRLIAVGTSVQLYVPDTAGLDSNGYAMRDAAGVRAAAASATFFPSQVANAVSVTTQGLVTATATGYATVFATFSYLGQSGIYSYCDVQVP